jgi:hypothetical protein
MPRFGSRVIASASKVAHPIAPTEIGVDEHPIRVRPLQLVAEIAGFLKSPAIEIGDDGDVSQIHAAAETPRLINRDRLHLAGRIERRSHARPDPTGT